MAQYGVVVAVIGPQDVEQKSLALGFPAADAAEHLDHLLRGVELVVSGYRFDKHHGLIDHALDQLVQQFDLGAKIMIERALGDAHLVDNILDRRLFVTPGVEHLLRGIENLTAPNLGFFHHACHAAVPPDKPTDRRSVGQWVS